MDSLKRYLISIVFALLVLGASFFAGVFIGSRQLLEVQKPETVINADSDKSQVVDFTPFWKVWNTLQKKHIEIGTTTKKTTDQEKLWGAITGLVASLGDPYTIFFPPTEAKIFEEEISGNFEGVGMEIGVKDGVLTVVAPLKGTPAYRAGILAGDKIIQIDNLETSSMNVDEAVKRIRGKVGTSVVITIVRLSKKEPIKFTLVRDIINIPTIDTKLRPDGVFVINLYNFSAVSPNLFRKALREFIQADTDKLVIDLRGNPGGYLEAAIDMASWFLPAGEVIVREDFNSNSEPTIYRSKGYNIFNENLKLVILVDNGSASASEIFAGALREHGVAALIGTKTFGKGSVQELVPITSDTSLKVTVAEWLTPNGISISEHGLEPDIEVKVKPEDLKNGKDPQLVRAIEFLLKK